MQDNFRKINIPFLGPKFKTRLKIKNIKYKTGEMAQWLGWLTAVQEDLCWIPSTHTAGHNCLIPVPGDLMFSSDLWGYQTQTQCTGIPVGKTLIQIKYTNFQKIKCKNHFPVSFFGFRHHRKGRWDNVSKRSSSEESLLSFKDRHRTTQESWGLQGMRPRAHSMWGQGSPYQCSNHVCAFTLWKFSEKSWCVFCSCL